MPNPGNRTPRSPAARRTPNRVRLDAAAAAALRRMALASGLAPSRAQAEIDASAIIRAWLDPRTLAVSDIDPAALRPWVETARRACFNPAAQQMLDRILAALDDM